MAKRLRLRIANGELQGEIFEITESGLRLGRSSSNDIHVPDEELSRNHCLFEQSGEAGARLTDLASANGTFLNGKVLGSDPVELAEGDLIEVGTTTIEVLGETKLVKVDEVDLGLEKKSEAPSEPAAVTKRKAVMNLLWVVVVILVSVAIYVVINAPKGEEKTTSPALAPEAEQQVKEFYYERVSASNKGIFRYELKYSEDGTLSVKVDDMPDENRHAKKDVHLSDAARAELGNILAFEAVRELEPDYAGMMPDPPALESYRLKVVYSGRVRKITITNVQEPEKFRHIRERLEAFSKSELGVWAIQYSKETLMEMATEALELADSKWNDRDANYGNLHAAIVAYRSAITDLETINPKPAIFKEATEGLKRATEELEARYKDQRFRSDRAYNLGQYEEAKRELQIILEMIPDRADDRYREANGKLLDTDKRLTNQNGGKRK